VNSVAIYLKNNDLPQSTQRTPRENARNADIPAQTGFKKTKKTFDRINRIDNIIIILYITN